MDNSKPSEERILAERIVKMLKGMSNTKAKAILRIADWLTNDASIVQDPPPYVFVELPESWTS